MAKKDVEYRISLEDMFSRKIKRAEKSSNSFEKSITRVGKKMAGVFAVREIVQLGNEVVKTTAQFEGFENAIGFLSGGAQEGAQSMAFLEKNSNDLGISLQASIEGFQTLAGGFKGTGTKLEDIKDIFQKTSVAASAMNLSGERTKLVLLALGQMASKGVVSMEELRRQLGDSLPGSAGIAARAMKMTTQDFNKLVESGQLLSKDFLPKFASELEKTFAGGLAKSTKSVRANLNRLENSFLKLKVGIGRKFNPEIKGSIKFLTKLSKSAEKFVRVPMSKQIKDQSRELLRLKLEINNTNTSEEDKLKILGKLKEINPDIVKGIDSQKINYENLNTAIDKVNSKMLNQIVISTFNEKKQKKLNEQQVIGNKLTAEEVRLGEDVVKESEDRVKANLKNINEFKNLQSELKRFQELAKKEPAGKKGVLGGVKSSAEQVDDLKERIKDLEPEFVKSQKVVKTFRKAFEETSGKDVLQRAKAISAVFQNLKLTQSGKTSGTFGAFQSNIITIENLRNQFKELGKEVDASSIKTDKLRKILGLAGSGGGKGGKIEVLGADAQDTVTTIKAAAPKTFNINIAGSLVDKFILESKNITEGAVQAGNIVAQELAKALADIQAVSK